MHDHGGFSTTIPWMRVNDDYVQCNAEEQLFDADSVFTFWRRVLKLRKRFWDILVYGRFEMVKHNNETLFCYRRIYNMAVATIILNFSDQQQLWSPPPDVRLAWKNGKEVLANYSTRRVLTERNVSVKPFEAVVLIEGQSAHHL